MYSTLKREIRNSSFGDYFAIDEIDEISTVISTPLYLKKNEEKKIKMRWDFEVSEGSRSFKQYEMIDAFIRYNGCIVEVSYCPEQMLASSTKYWFEPSEFELKNKSIIHFKN